MNVTYFFQGIYASGSLSTVREEHRKALSQYGYTNLEDFPPSDYKLDAFELKFGEVVDPTVIEKVLLDEDYVQKCDTIPSYSAAKRNGVISMNPYSRGRVFMRSKTIVNSRKVGEVLIQEDGPSTSAKMGYFKVTETDGYVWWSQYTYSVQARITGFIPYYEKVTVSGPVLENQPTIDTSNLETGVFTSLMASVARSDFDIATNVGESKKTVEGFATLLPKLFDDMAKLRKLATKLPKDLMGRKLATWQIRKAILEAPEVVADYRLLWRYGISPVYQASKDLAKALQPKSNPLFQTVRDGDSSTLEVPGWKGTIELKAHGIWKGRFTLADADVKRYSLYIPTMMYELVPYSFVADWFVNLGDLIAAVRPLPTQYSNSCVSTKCEADLRWLSEWEVKARSGTVSQYFDFGPNYGLQQLSGKLTVIADFIEVETGRYYAQTFRRGQGRLGLSTTTDLTLNQSLDALALLWKQLASRRRHSFWSV